MCTAQVAMLSSFGRISPYTSCSAIATSERFYILFYRCDDIKDFASPTINVEFLSTFASFAVTT